MKNRLVEQVNQCGCFKQECGCLGQEGCDCCFPTCGCAPRPGTPQYDVMSYQTEENVEEPYQDISIVRKPRVETIQKTVQEPEVYDETITIDEPYLETVTKTRKVPKVIFEPVTEEFTDFEIKEVPGEREEEVDVKTIITVPKPVMTRVEVEEPKEIQKEITE